MHNLLDRFVRYARINTRSNEEITDRTPTTDNQWDLARLLEKELNEMGTVSYTHLTLPTN